MGTGRITTMDSRTASGGVAKDFRVSTVSTVSMYDLVHTLYIVHTVQGMSTYQYTKKLHFRLGLNTYPAISRTSVQCVQ